MTIEEYNRLNVVYNARAEQKVYEESKNLRENADEVVAKYRREQLKFIRSEGIQEEKKEKEAERESYAEFEEEPETSSAQPFGKWQTIVTKYGLSTNFHSLDNKTIHFGRLKIMSIFLTYTFFCQTEWRSQLISSYRKQASENLVMSLLQLHQLSHHPKFSKKKP